MENNTQNTVQTWLTTEGWALKDLAHENTRWLIEARDPEKRPFLISQQKTPEDQVRIQAILAFDESAQSNFAALPKDKKDRCFWEIKFRLLQMGMNFVGLGEPLKRVVLTKNLYLDGFNKNLFMHTIETVRNAMLMVLWALQREMAKDTGITGQMIH
jgi:hypothetical protein